MWQPLVGNHHFAVCLESHLHPSHLPIPEYNIPSAIPATDPLPIWWEANLACVPCNGMSHKLFLLVLPEIVCAVHENLIIQRLGHKVPIYFPLSADGVKWSEWHSLEWWRVTTGIECMCSLAMYFITTGISKSQAWIVLLSDVVTNHRFSSTNVIMLTGPKCWSYSCVISPEFMSYYDHVKLRSLTAHGTHYLDDLVWHTSQENVLLVIIGMKLDNIWCLTITKLLQTLASLSVPQFHLVVVPTWQESPPIIGEGNILDSLDMAMECAQTISMVIHIPELN